MRARDVSYLGADFDDKVLALDALDIFCTSTYTSISEFSHTLDPDTYSSKHIDIISHIFNNMYTGAYPCTHNAYLKIYHILLANGSIHHDELDLLLIDECNDLFGCTIEIFKLLPAKQKLMVGDMQQSIMGFMRCVDGFRLLKSEGKLMTLPQSFRVSSHIAPKVEAFCQTYLDPTMEFTGLEYPEIPTTMTSSAYITRNNAPLIDKMIELTLAGKPYNLIGRVQNIFKLPILLVSLKRGYIVKNPEYKFLEQDMKDYYGSRSLRKESPTIFQYVMKTHSDDAAIKAACTLIMKYSPARIIKMHKISISHKKKKISGAITLVTAFGAKGLTWDEVEIGEDLNVAMSAAIEDNDSDPSKWSYNDKSLARLYYTAVTRPKYKLTNARHIY